MNKSKNEGRMMNKKLLLGLFAGLLASIGTHASDDLSYSYVQVVYVGELGGGGFRIAGSVEVGSQVHILASYGKINSNSGFFGTDVDTTTWLAGVGYHKDIAEKASFFGEVSYVDVELDNLNFGDVSDDGFVAAIGIRGLVASKIELVGGISYVDLDDAGDDTSFNAGIRFNASDTVSFGVHVHDTDDGFSVSAGVRIYWGK